MFDPFDPLSAKTIADTEVAALAQKREISNILSSYVGWYDPFSELIQNSLDSLELKQNGIENDYSPKIWITINIQENSLPVTDNGLGLTEDQFKQFLCPDISFKSGNTRGHKGVGATYLAYGFNYIQVASKTEDYEVVGKMEGARKWLSDENPSGNPKIRFDDKGVIDENFNELDTGVSIHLKFDKTTHPKDLRWIVTDTAENWFKILTIKTGLGSFIENEDANVFMKVIDRNGQETNFTKKGIGYFSPHNEVKKAESYKAIVSKERELFKKKGAGFKMPAKYKNLDVIYERWDHSDVQELVDEGQISFTEDEVIILENHTPSVYVAYTYSVKIWDAIKESLGARANANIIYGGIQIAANNMPQGETIQIPLNRNIGRQNQIHILIHFDNCSADLGRKGFQNDIVEFTKEISKKLADGPLANVKKYLRVNTGNTPNLKREAKVEDWKTEMEKHEDDNPLNLISESFFLPSKKISITSKPTREQDVIALFNQLLAGGVIRGLRIMSTNERLTYDGLVRIVIEEPRENHKYHEKENPIGVEESVIQEFDLPLISKPKILEYKYSLDGLIEDIENGTKNSNDVSIVICWETGNKYEHNYQITSLLDPDNLVLREYHGITHVLTNITTSQKEMDLIVLSELIDYLNNPEETIKEQIKKYDA